MGGEHGSWIDSWTPPPPKLEGLGVTFQLRQDIGKGLALGQKWILQFWLFIRADVAWLCGRRAQAVAAAGRAIEMGNGGPLSRGGTGTFARWTAVLHRMGAATDSTVLDGLHRALMWRQELDQLDQYELLAAVRAIEGQAEHETEITHLWTRQPAGSLAFLERFSLNPINLRL